MNLFAKKNKSGTPQPPEPEFFDSGDRKTKKSLIWDFFKKWWVWIALGISILSVLTVIFVYSHFHKKTNKFVIQTDEKRVLSTPFSMENAIDASSKSKKAKVVAPREDSSLRDKKQKRKYDSRIAVFVAEPEKPNPIRDPKPERKNQMRLGLASGTKIPAFISNRIFSFNVAAPVTAVVAKDFMWKDKVVIPKDSQFLGEVNVLKSIDRINVRFDLLIFPDGREMHVKAMALSEDGSAGIRGKVEKHTDKKVLKAVGESVLSVGSLFLGARSQTPFSLEDQLQLNLAQNLGNEAQRDLRNVQVEKSITVEAYTPIQVILLEAI